MTLLWMDGFDHYGTSGVDIATYANGAYLPQSGSIISSQISSGGLMGSCLRVDANGISGNKTGPKRDVGSQTEIGVGFHFLTNSIAGNAQAILSFQSAAAAFVGNLTIDFGTGRLILRSGDQVSSGYATSTLTISPSVWYHMEVRYKKSATVGLMEVRVNGATYATFSGNTGATAIGLVVFGGSASSGNFAPAYFYDNLYIWNTAGTENNDWLGERNVYTLTPNADTALAQWTKSTGTDGFDLINDVPPSPLTRYIEGNVVLDESAFDVVNMPSTDVQVRAVQVIAQGQKSGTTSNEIQFGTDDGTNRSTSTSFAVAQDTPAYFQHIVELNPTTGVAWTGGEIDTLKVFIKRSV